MVTIEDALKEVERLQAAREQLVPLFDFAEIPEAEKQAASALQHCLWNLEQFTRAFQSDLALFDYSYARFLDEMKNVTTIEISERRPDDPSKGWMTIAGRDGAMSIYHFGTAMKGVRDGLARCPTLRTKVVHNELRAAIRKFEGRMPVYVDMRDAVAHAADLLLSPEHMREHRRATSKADRVDLRRAHRGRRALTGTPCTCHNGGRFERSRTIGRFLP